MARVNKKKSLFRKLLLAFIFFSFIAGIVFGSYKIYRHYHPTIEEQLELAWQETDMDKEHKKYIKKFQKTQDPEKILYMVQNYKKYPIDILKYVNDDIDRFDYGYKYPKRKNKEYTKDLKEKEVKTLTHLLQWDTRWGYQYYGEAPISKTGCAPTCLSMVLSYLKQDPSLTPSYIAKYSEKNDFYVKGAGSAWNLLPAISKKVGVGCTQIQVSKNDITKALKEKHPVILSVNPGDFTRTGHFIVLKGINKDGTIQVLDPNSKKNTKKSWKINTLLKQTAAAYEFYK